MAEVRTLVRDCFRCVDACRWVAALCPLFQMSSNCRLRERQSNASYGLPSENKGLVPAGNHSGGNGDIGRMSSTRVTSVIQCAVNWAN